MTVETLESVRTEESFKLFWAKALKMGSDIGVVIMTQNPSIIYHQGK